ncbi:hypothetical protein D3C75_904080 [compost metagenome]
MHEINEKLPAAHNIILMRPCAPFPLRFIQNIRFGEYRKLDNRFAEIFPGRERCRHNPEMLIHIRGFLGQVGHIIHIHIKSRIDIVMNITRTAVFNIRVQSAGIQSVDMQHLAVLNPHRSCSIVTQHIPGQPHLLH